MKEFILDSSLTVIEKGFPEYRANYFFNGDIKGYESITNMDTPIAQRNYMDYLVNCWRLHYGAIITPTILWNIVLNNLAFQVNKTPDVYRKYFTTSDKKQEICVMQGGNLIDVALLIDGLSGRMPTKIMPICFPDFSTDTEKSKIANYTAFLDMVSPYYNYSMFLCGIPKIKVLGTKEDWNIFMFNIGQLAAMLPECCLYIINVANRVGDIIDDSCNYAEFFTLTKCGSGSQVEVMGWICDFFIEQPEVLYPENFISCISKIDYHNYNDNKDYRMFAGLFKSIIENDYLVPDFDNIYFVKK